MSIRAAYPDTPVGKNYYVRVTKGEDTPQIKKVNFNGTYQSFNLGFFTVNLEPGETYHYELLEGTTPVNAVPAMSAWELDAEFNEGPNGANVLHIEADTAAFLNNA